MSITRRRAEGETVFSNQHDKQLRLSEKNVKESGMYHPHHGWFFLGSVYWDEGHKLFINEIKIYGNVVNIITDTTLKGVIRKANGQYGICEY